MAGFHTHITTSTVLGIGYAGVGILAGVPADASLVAGGLCGVSGMLPDLDSDSGVPLRETTAFAAAVIPMLLVDQFATLGLSYSAMVLATMSIYILIRFGIAGALKKYTVHRGMFHSIPAALIFAELGFLICGCQDLNLRYFNAGGVLLGVMSHLLLDELYSIEWYRGRLRLKSSFGTAIKFWGRNLWGNVSVYAKLIAVTMIVLGEPMVMERFHDHQHHAPEMARQDDAQSEPSDQIAEGRLKVRRQIKSIYDTAHDVYQSLNRRWR